MDSVKTILCRWCHGAGTEIDRKATGTDLRRRRLQRNLTLTKVASRMRISKPYLSDLETGQRAWRIALIKRFIKSLR
jgi:predicted transcriptional regulator